MIFASVARRILPDYQDERAYYLRHGVYPTKAQWRAMKKKKGRR